jgi:DNA-binding GntR family transcriptional regulator
MKNIIDLFFLYETKDMKNVKIEKQLKEVQENINKRIDYSKYTKQFINEFIEMYDNEQLYKVMRLIQLEIQKRHRKELNNEL